ncbi:MAG: YbaB/EbfC family nucleoid-associated protein [Alphaproteobacteria bacterium]|nr:YbaB/EbfC family nucleoid-associated protein [Alphaproteobacteria bacterium]
MKNIGNMLKQARDMQSRLDDMQKMLESYTAQGSCPNDMVKATYDGKGNLINLDIHDSLLGSENKAKLEQSIVEACQDAKLKVDQHIAEYMGDLKSTFSGLNLPF